MRRFFATVVALVVMLVPVSAAAAETPEVLEGAGTAQTGLDLVSVSLEVEGVLADLLGAVEVLEGLDVATASSYASLDPDSARNTLGAGEPFARAALTLPVLGDLEARSDGNTSRGGEQVVLPAGLGSLNLAGLLAIVEDGAARARVDALAGNVTTLVGGLTAAVPGDGGGATVDALGALAGQGAEIENLRLALGDVLPEELLELLPLDVLLDLIDTLPIDVEGLDDLMTSLEALLAEAEAVNELRDDVVAIVDELNTALAPLDDALANGTGLSATQLDVLVDDLEGLLGELDGLLEELVDSVQLILELIALIDLDLEGLLDDIVDNLAALELVHVGRIGATVNAEAAADSSQAVVDCSVSDVRVLGAAVPEIDVCAELSSALDGVRGTLLGVLEALPVAGDVTGDLVHIGGLQSSATPANAADGDYHVARAALTGLELRVASVDLSATVDALVDGLLDELDGLLDLLSGDLLEGLELPVGASSDDVDSALGVLLGSGVPTLDVGLDQLVGDLATTSGSSESGDDDVTDAVRDVLSAFADGGVAAPAGFTDAASAIDALRDALAALPTGDLLAGVSTPGLTVRALDLSSEAEFVAAGAPEPIPQPELPRTGAGVFPVALLLLAGAGLGTAAVRRMR